MQTMKIKTIERAIQILLSLTHNVLILIALKLHCALGNMYLWDILLCVLLGLARECFLLCIAGGGFLCGSKKEGKSQEEQQLGYRIESN
ncbi:hypothetical protein ACJX0J_011917, partial [Zea mays]